MTATTSTDASALQYRKSLITRAKSGDEAAFADYLKLNIGLFEKTLSRYSKYAVNKASIEDMRQEGMLGLLQGLAHYTEERAKTDRKPEGYIFSWVRAYISNYARNNGIAAAKTTLTDVQLNSEDGDEYSLFDTIEDERADIDLLYRDREVDFMFHKVTAALLPKERIVAQRRLFTDEPDTLDVIGAELGVSRERIRQIEGHAREKIQEKLKQELHESDVYPPGTPREWRVLFSQT